MHALSNKIKNLKKSKSSFFGPKFLVFDVKTFDQNSEYVFKEVRKKFKKKIIDHQVFKKTTEPLMLENITVN